ncbi:MAG: BadF/BadG/BcrA/BcrD ATPase family protein [Bacillota bacterium]
MRYALGVDGGATKTMAVIGDETGKVLGVGLGGPTNYQITGIETAMKHVGDAVAMALGAVDLRSGQVDNAVFGMAGADFPVDFENFNTGIGRSFPGLKFAVTNDTWVGFRAGTENDFGGVVISGTGANYAAAGPDGIKITGRGMGYEWGSEGGAGSLIRQIMHHAFRSHDGTGPKTGLEEAVLALLDFPSYDDLSAYMYKVHGEFGHIYMKVAQLVPALFELAFRGDPVAQSILSDTGTVMGEIIGGMMARLGMQAVPADVVLVGSIFTKGICPLMISSLRTACQRQIPLATFRPVEMEPAAGGFLMALEGLGVEVRGPLRQTVIGTLPELPLVPGA